MLRHAVGRVATSSVLSASAKRSAVVVHTISTAEQQANSNPSRMAWMGMAMAASAAAMGSALCDAPPLSPIDRVQSPTENPSVPLDRVLNRQLQTPVAGVQSYSAASYKANNPIEDRFVVHAKDGVVYAAVLDGHGGWQVSQYAHDHLIKNAQAELNKLHAKSTANVQAALQQAFLRTDLDIREIVRPAFNMGFHQVNRVGACSQLAYLKDDMLVVANAGDCRAVLGSVESDSLVAIPMSNDHNAKLPVEMARLSQAHPNEPNIVVCKHPESCYVKGGLQPTRALGDFAFKDASLNGPADPTLRAGGRHIADPYTPPYVLALPETLSHVVTGADKFLILGSDGVWDFLTNQEAVDIVQACVARGEADEASRAIVEAVLTKAALVEKLTLGQLLDLAPGRKRRSVHDDTTVVVLVFA
ncbi:hypothetical protein H310_06201 [Aphanomyces invadans]|uniref:PPM-type phosphatase domain-containing protein n=1 Tax=Aphanomyces invadans TaxID=157072 RepID=A0A024U563_9STRA|nr:hypothetical protein H310_06201 [Aphanomyces invadans]ETW01546.1 hypothetical protein H310_06201 [Aphanomyces invadans]|eukprot:XP_008869394.1 hypothetical protein H310_06201 [Aphanomyces invadans]